MFNKTKHEALVEKKRPYKEVGTKREEKAIEEAIREIMGVKHGRKTRKE